MNLLRKVQFHEVARAERVYRSHNLWERELNCWPACGRQNQDGETSGTQVLLIAQVLIGGNEDIESRFGGPKQVPIFERSPAHLVRGRNSMSRQCVAQRCGRSLVEKNSHWGR
jgi:hypothetical protein